MKQTTLLSILVFGFLVFCPPQVFSQSEAQIKKMISSYKKAILSKDEEVINNAWLRLSQTPEALAYMRTNTPRLYQSYEFWRVKRELEELKRKRFLSASFGGIRSTAGPKTYRDTDRPNQETVRENPNSAQRSNRSVATSFPNQDRRPNQDVARDNPNQERLSNQERIRNRLRSIR